MSLSMFDLTGKVAIVTGAGRGIGKAIAVGLGGAGARVAVAARTSADIEAVAEEIKAAGSDAIAVVTDMRNTEQVDELVKQTVERFGTIDILVNNAGGSFLAPFEKLSDRAWDAILNLNLKSAIACTRAVGNFMIEKGKGGSIIMVASLVGLHPWIDASHYSAAKAALISVTRSLSLEWAKYNIRANAIAPGFVDTPGFSLLEETMPEFHEATVQRIPMKRFAKPEEIAGAAIYLGSDAASYVTGSVLLISGGLITPS